MRSKYIKRLTSKLPPGSKLPPLSTAAELILGAVAGALAQIFTIPVSVIATRQQVGRPEGPAGNGLDKEVDDSLLGVASMIEEEGVTGLWHRARTRPHRQPRHRLRRVRAREEPGAHRAGHRRRRWDHGCHS